MGNNSFESSLKRLNEIVHALESGNQDLDSSLALFAEGTEIIRNCNELLDAAEQKVTIMKDGAEAPFEV